MICKDIPPIIITIVLYYIWAAPFNDSDDDITCFQWCILPIVILFTPITLILDLIILPFVICYYCCIKERRSGARSDSESSSSSKELPLKGKPYLVSSPSATPEEPGEIDFNRMPIAFSSV